MRVEQFDEWAMGLIVADDHDEIVAVRKRAGDNPTAHTRFEVQFASGAKAYVMVRRVEGPGVPRHSDYEVPKEALR